jgi:hypothetical protein
MIDSQESSNDPILRQASGELIFKASAEEDACELRGAYLEGMWLSAEEPVSKGSARHGEGLCKPCLFHSSEVGCKNGADCGFCHYPHKRKNKPRFCKGKRERIKKILGKGSKPDDEENANGEREATDADESKPKDRKNANDEQETTVADEHGGAEVASVKITS